MDMMDIDHIVDVPDTPDRQTRQVFNCKNVVENGPKNSPSTPSYLRKQNISKKEGTKDQPVIIDSGSKGPPKFSNISSNSRLPNNFTDSSFPSSSNSGNVNLFRRGDSYRNHGIGMEFVGNDIQEKHGNGGLISRDLIGSPRINKQMRFVRNGLISPNNTAKTKPLARKEDNNGSKSKPLASAPTTAGIDIRELVADDRDSYTRKGKGVITYPCSSKEPDSRNNDLQNSDYNNCASRSIADSGGWRSTRNRNSEIIMSSPDDESLVIRGRTLSRYSSQHHENRSRRSENRGSVSNDDDDDDKGLKLISSERVYPQPSKNGSHSTANTRGKHGSTSSTDGQCSNSSSTFRHSCDLEQIIELDEFSPRPRRNARDEDARVRQLEADELLACELQEQFYNEVPVFGSEEIDEHLALALQHQNDSSHGYPRRAYRSRQSQSRSSSAPRRGSVARSVIPGRVTRMRRRFDEDMDVELRNMLGALEELDNMGVGATARILHAPRDFNENDYEMLLALDNNNDRHSGASVRQINGLPQSTVQTKNFEEICAVCLETPTIGETIRHLPCLHKFHKDCIDPWLRRRTSCPVCKSSVT